MTSTAGRDGQAPGGHALSAKLQQDFYANLARLEHDILTSQHPRFKLPKAALEQLAASLNRASLASPSAPAASHHASAPFINGGFFGANLLPPIQASGPPSLSGVPREARVQAPLAAKPPASKIDPVLLTKSDDLLRAELRLKRQRIERSLKEAVDKSKASMTEKEAGALTGPLLFDGDKVLEQARKLVAPLSGLHPPATNDASAASSFDENSYYSSRFNSWSEEEGEYVSDSRKKPEAHSAPRETIRIPGLNEKPAEVNPHHSLRTLRLIPSPNLQPPANSSAPATEAADATMQLSREESYSPPAAYAFPQFPVPKPANDVVDSAPRGPRLLERLAHASNKRPRDSESYSPPPPLPMPVIRNAHLPVPAPQTSGHSPVGNGRVTQNPPVGPSNQGPPHKEPMAARQDKKRQTRMKKQDAKKGQGPSDTSNGSSNAPFNPRKRRREEKNDAGRRVSGKRRPAAASPEPYIKPEPISPPAITSNPAEAPRRLVLRDDGRADIEVLSAARKQPRTVSAYGDFGYASDVSGAEGRMNFRFGEREPIYIDGPEVTSPPVQRRIARDDHDLRRVASMQYASHPRTPSYRDLQYPSEEMLLLPQQPRRIERHASHQPQYYDEPLTSPVFQARPQERYNSPFRGAEYVPAEVESRRMMPPPPPPKRRIVVDEYGNEYIAVPAGTSARHSIAREVPSESRPIYVRDPYREQTEHVPLPRERSRTMRPPPQVIELDDDDDDDWRVMAPPPPPPPQARPRTQPRLVEVQDDLHRRPNFAYQDPRGMRAASMQPLSAPAARQQLRPVPPPAWPGDDEPPRFQERAYSARPGLVQDFDGHARRFAYDTGDATWQRM